jgi:hypothetical protein
MFRLELEEEKMPLIFVMCAVPAIIFVDGGIYLISHLH